MPLKDLIWICSNIVVGKAIVRHGLELVPKSDKIQYHDQKEPEHNLSHLDSRRCVTGQLSNGATT